MHPGQKRSSKSCSTPRSQAWFADSFVAPTPAQAEAWPAIKAAPPHADCRADRLGQDARGVPCGDRRTGAPGARRTSDRRDPGGLRLAAEGAVERHSPQSGGAARRASGRTPPERGCPMSRSAPGCGPATRRRRARAHAPAAAAYPGDDAGIALRPARLGIGPQDAGDRPLGDRRRNPCDRAEQARRPSRALARAPRRPLRRPVAAHRPFGHAKPGQRRCAFSGRRRSGRRAGRRGRDRRHRASAPARSRPRVARLPARGGDVGRSLDPGL